jgi:hypothetical protein
MEAEATHIEQVTYHAGLAVTVILLLLVAGTMVTILIRRAVDSIFRKRAQTKRVSQRTNERSKAMAIVKDEYATNITRRAALNSPEPDTAESANDYHKRREQDQAVNQLAHQLAQCAPTMKESAVVDMELFHGCEPTDPITRVARMLGLMSAPIASVGDLRNGSSPGSMHYVQVGSSKIVTSTKDRAREICAGLNEDTWALIAPYRDRILAQLHDYAMTRAQPEVSQWNAHIQLGNQWAVFTATSEDAKDLLAQWEAVYWKHVAPAQALILQDLAAVTAAGVGPEGHQA